MLKSETIAKMPKIELHCHLDGSLSLPCIKKLAQKSDIQLPPTDSEILEKAQAPENTSSLMEYLARFDFILPLLQTAENLELAAYDVVEQAAAENVKYIEIRFAPNQHLQGGLTPKQVVEAVITGLARAEKDFKIKANALICGLRQENLADLQNLVPLFDQISDRHLVAFDLAGDEINYPQITFSDLLGQVTSRGVHLTLHAGECPHCEQNVISSVALGASRIGHGVMSKNIRDYWQTLINQKIVLEMAPTSNFQTKSIMQIEDYPFKDFYDAGIRVTLNTDNRTVSNTTLQKEYEKIASWYDFQVGDFEKINHYAVDGAFITDAEKSALHAQVTAEFMPLVQDNA